MFGLDVTHCGKCVIVYVGCVFICLLGFVLWILVLLDLFAGFFG